MTDLHAATLIEEVIKAGTSAGAKKGWEERKHGQFSTHESHAEYMGLHSRVSKAREEIRYRKSSYDQQYKKLWKVGGKSAGIEGVMKLHSEAQAKAEGELEDLKKKSSEFEKTGRHEHPEWGQFVRQPNAQKHLGGSSVTYLSPSGDSVSHYGFGGWSMQRVAPSYSVESKHGKKEWSGHAGQSAANNFLHDVYGIGATDDEKNTKVKFKTGK